MGSPSLRLGSQPAIKYAELGWIHGSSAAVAEPAGTESLSQLSGVHIGNTRGVALAHARDPGWLGNMARVATDYRTGSLDIHRELLGMAQRAELVNFRERAPPQSMGPKQDISPVFAGITTLPLKVYHTRLGELQ